MASTANKVVKNTGILYGKMIITMGISFYTTRVILEALGVVDYGIFTLIAGVVAMLAFLNAAMTTSTQRYLSFHQGTNDTSLQKKIFSNSLFLHLCLGLFLVACIEIIGLFLFDGFLNVPEDRIGAAKIIFHFMVLSVFFSVVSVPFVASINAHEDMLWIAVVDIVEVLLKLLVAIILSHGIVNIDNLVFFGFSTAIIGLVALGIYTIFCTKKYEECTLHMKSGIEKPLLLELTSFAGWNLYGSLCGVGRVQGLAVILNLFFGTKVNAAYGIANQVSGQMNFFSSTMLRALNPQIMKSEGAGDRQRMLQLSIQACKYGFFLLAIIAIPCIFEMHAILDFWLKSVPEHTVIFCQLILIGIMINQMTIGLQSAIQATGRIKLYQTLVGSIILLNLPLAYLLLRMGLPAYSVLILYAILEILACSLRLILLKRIANLSIKDYIAKVLFKLFIPSTIVIFICYIIVSFVDIPYRFLLTATISAIIFIISMYYIGLEKEEISYINQSLNKLRSKWNK